jgi:hypothetical protein
MKDIGLDKAGERRSRSSHEKKGDVFASCNLQPVATTANVSMVGST